MTDNGVPIIEHGLLALSEAEWGLAVRNAALIAPLARRDVVGRRAAADAATQLGVSVRQVYILSYRLANIATLMFKRELAAALEALPPRSRPGTGGRATMIPISPQLLPRPADWPATVHLTGHWSANPEETGGDKELTDFVEDGGFVYAGFGSMKAGDSRARGKAIMEAARRNGMKTLVAEGWGGVEIPAASMASDVLVRESVNHHLVLPRAFAAIHHGGAGTVHAVARAGIPSVVVPFIADQPFWASLLHQRGLAPEAIPYRKLTARGRPRGGLSPRRGLQQ